MTGHSLADGTIRITVKGVTEYSVCDSRFEPGSSLLITPGHLYESHSSAQKSFDVRYLKKVEPGHFCSTLYNILIFHTVLAPPCIISSYFTQYLLHPAYYPHLSLNTCSTLYNILIFHSILAPPCIISSSFTQYLLHPV